MLPFRLDPVLPISCDGDESHESPPAPACWNRAATSNVAPAPAEPEAATRSCLECRRHDPAYREPDQDWTYQRHTDRKCRGGRCRSDFHPRLDFPGHRTAEGPLCSSSKAQRAFLGRSCRQRCSISSMISLPIGRLLRTATHHRHGAGSWARAGSVSVRPKRPHGASTAQIRRPPTRVPRTMPWIPAPSLSTRPGRWVRPLLSDHLRHPMSTDRFASAEICPILTRSRPGCRASGR